MAACVSALLNSSKDLKPPASKTEGTPSRDLKPAASKASNASNASKTEDSYSASSSASAARTSPQAPPPVSPPLVRVGGGSRSEGSSLSPLPRLPSDPPPPQDVKRLPLPSGGGGAPSERDNTPPPQVNLHLQAIEETRRIHAHFWKSIRRPDDVLDYSVFEPPRGGVSRSGEGGGSRPTSCSPSPAPQSEVARGAEAHICSSTAMSGRRAQPQVVPAAAIAAAGHVTAQQSGGGGAPSVTQAVTNANTKVVASLRKARQPLETPTSSDIKPTVTQVLETNGPAVRGEGTGGGVTLSLPPPQLLTPADSGVSTPKSETPNSFSKEFGVNSFSSAASSLSPALSSSSSRRSSRSSTSLVSSPATTPATKADRDARKFQPWEEDSD